MSNQLMTNRYAPLKYISEQYGEARENELPFVVGIMADFNKKQGLARDPLKERRFIVVDADSIQTFFDTVKPSITLNLKKIAGIDDSDEEQMLHLAFTSFENAQRESVKRQINEKLVKCEAFDLSQHNIPEILEAVLGDRGVASLLGTLRGMHKLLNKNPSDSNVIFKVLDISKSELLNDVLSANAIQESALERLVYEHEYGTFEGTPYSLMLTDFYFSHCDADVKVMENIANLGAKTSCVFVVNAAMELFANVPIDHHTDWQCFDATFSSREFLRWRALRDNESSRFVAIALPLASQGENNDNESINPVFIIADSLLPSFTGKALWNFTSESETSANENARLTVDDNNTIAFQGFIPVDPLNNALLTEVSDLVSFQRPRKYFEQSTNDIASVMVSIPYNMLITSFQRYIGVITRDMIGGGDVQSITAGVNQWLQSYVENQGDQNSSDAQFLKPLVLASSKVEEVVGAPGMYKLHLKVQIKVAGFENAPCTQHVTNVIL